MGLYHNIFLTKNKQTITLFSAETKERERYNYRTIAIFHDRTPAHSYLWTEVAPSTGFVFSSWGPFLYTVSTPMTTEFGHIALLAPLSYRLD